MIHKAIFIISALIGIAGSGSGMMQFYSGFHDMDLDFNHSLIVAEFGKDYKNYGHMDTRDNFNSLGGDLFVTGAKKLFNGLGILILSSLLGGLGIGGLLGEIKDERPKREKK